MWIKRKWLVCGALRRDAEAKREQEKCDKVTVKCHPAFLGNNTVVHINVSTSTMVPSSIQISLATFELIRPTPGPAKFFMASDLESMEFCEHTFCHSVFGSFPSLLSRTTSLEYLYDDEIVASMSRSLGIL